METVLIDTFTVPEESKEAFMARARQMQAFIRRLPGFVEGYIYELRAGESRLNVVTMAVWESEAAIESAKRAVAAENQRQGVDPLQVTRSLGVELTRAVYGRAPY